ncbi:MAG: UDP-N-acetylmuramoyl-tripeptide--D-alanyl-D-alanine ligase [Phycisphaerales bacterium]|nr:UDP-N-acetylmuramoyl-tripeptide--D-alanyl-D-alanine ligase [Phycisphaerales bacterium]
MSGMDWDTIISVTGGSWGVEPAVGQMLPVGAAIDTRELHRGQIFVAYVGEQVDGHEYLEQANGLGAAMCVVTDSSKIPDGFDVPTLVVDDSTDALTALAKHWGSLLGGIIIGVTGSNGKTTTTRLIHAVLSRAGESWVSSKSHNNAIGVPMSILNAPIEARYVIFELGTSSPGEIADRAALVEPDISVITSIGRAHLEELGSIEGVCAEKASILGETQTLGIVPGGIDELDYAIGLASVGCEIERVAEDRLGNIEIADQSVSFDLDGYRFTAPVPGVHNASNAAMAVLVGRACNMSDADIAAGLAQSKLPEMRLDRIEIPTKSDSIVIYNDAYNANPDSTRAALAFFASIQSEANKVIILGDMLELGIASESEHQSMVADLDIDAGRVVLVGPMYARAAGQGDEICPKTDDHAMSELGRTIKPGDLVLLKGSRGIGLERLVYILINRHTPFARSSGRRPGEGNAES